jgi:hypothetical protein
MSPKVNYKVSRSEEIKHTNEISKERNLYNMNNNKSNNLINIKSKIYTSARNKLLF